MKKYLLSFSLIIAFTFYIALNNENVSSVVMPTPATGTSTGGTSAGAGTGPAGTLKDGTYTGSVANAFYGLVQVAAVIKNGALADIQLLQYPTSGGHTMEVNQAALPILKQEAIQAQSANVDIVSGATQTSDAFRESLISALAQAQA